MEILQELFPSLNPLRLVGGAPMLLALSESTLRAKSEAWRNVLEARVEQSWEQVSFFYIVDILSHGWTCMISWNLLC